MQTLTGEHAEFTDLQERLLSVLCASRLHVNNKDFSHTQEYGELIQLKPER